MALLGLNSPDSKVNSNSNHRGQNNNNNNNRTAVGTPSRAINTEKGDFDSPTADGLVRNDDSDNDGGGGGGRGSVNGGGRGVTGAFGAAAVGASDYEGGDNRGDGDGEGAAGGGGGEGNHEEGENNGLESFEEVKEEDPVECLFDCLLSHWSLIDCVFRHYASVNTRNPFRYCAEYLLLSHSFANCFLLSLFVLHIPLVRFSLSCSFLSRSLSTGIWTNN